MITYAPLTTKRNSRMLDAWRQQLQQGRIIHDMLRVAKILGLISLGAVLAIVGLI